MLSAYLTTGYGRLACPTGPKCLSDNDLRRFISFVKLGNMGKMGRMEKYRGMGRHGGIVYM